MFKHTATSTFGPIQRSKLDLMGIRFVEGEGGNAPAGGDAAAQAPAPLPAAAAAAGNGAGAGDGTGQGEQNAPWTKENFDPDRAFRLVENLRGDLAEQKTKTDAAIAAAVAQAQKDIVAQIGKGLGFGAAVVETDPAKLAATIAEKDTALTAAQAAAKAGAVSTAVALLAPGLGASAKLLLSNEQFKTSIASVEPTDEAAITAAITKALQANAALKATPPRSGSGEHTGATVQSLEAQLKVATEKRDFVETIRLKQAIAAARKA